MKTLALQRPRRRSRLWLAAGVAVAFVGGGLAAWLAVAQPPLLTTAAREHLRIAKQSTVLRQWFTASQLGTEEAWQSVLDYFPEPENRYYVRRAQEQLAQIYLREEHYPRAMELFQKFAAAADDSEEELRAFGLAGQCGVLTLEGKYAESAEILKDVLPLRGKLKNERMLELLEFVIKKNGAELGVQTPREWEQWLNERLRQGS